MGTFYGKTAFAIAAGCGVLVCIFFGVGAWFHAQRSISFVFDPRISCTQRKLLARHIKKLCDSSLPTSGFLFTQLQKIFPVISSVSVKKLAPCHAHVTICAYEPRLIMRHNEQNLVVTEAVQPVASDYYTKRSCEDLPSIHFLDTINDQTNSLIVHWLFQMPDFFSEKYDVIWKSKYQIVLMPHALHNCVVLTHYHIPLKNIEPFLELLQKQVDEKNSNKKTKKQWLADVRMNNRIILSPYVQGKV